eukprot:m.111710 g.111710  ORF g.111710 m.111710 type:complete len:56 (-) comp14069_c0_seq2:47-214(-)
MAKQKANIKGAIRELMTLLHIFEIIYHIFVTKNSNIQEMNLIHSELPQGCNSGIV